DIRSGRVLLDAQAASGTGDRLLLLVDAEPDRDRFDLKADLRAPKGGLVTTAAGLAQPLAVTASGAGTWARWTGQMAAKLGDADAATQLADLKIEAVDGRFALAGDLMPATLFPGGLIAATLSPAVRLDATLFRDGDWFELTVDARSPAVALVGSGRIDTTDNRVEAVRIAAMLRQPAAVNPALSGSGIRADAQIEGALADPAVRWTVAADTLRFQGKDGVIGANGVAAEGQLKLAAGKLPLRVPFSATLKSTSGLPAELAALLVRPRLTGTVTSADGRIGGEGLRLTTARMTATGNAALLPSGQANANLTANLPRFEVSGLGPVALVAKVALNRPPGAGVSVNGRFEARSLGLSSAAARDFLGGNPVASGNFTLAPDGRIALTGGALASPNLTAGGARGSYDPASGRFTLDASGRSRAYGPFSVTASGTSANPRGTLKLASPGFGFDVTNLVADITPAPGGILLVARGESPQGPLDGRVVVGFGDGQPLSLTIERAAIAGLEGSGRLVQTPEGPFAGTLVIDGRGLDAKLGFSAQGALQRVEAEATALNARIPLETPIAISKGRAVFDVVLAPESPQIRGAFRASGVRRGSLLFTDLAGSANLVGLGGVATLTASGRADDGEGFSGNARVQSVADGYLIGLDAKVGKLPLKLERPARLVRQADGWKLLPARLILPRGQVMVAGEVGERREVRLALTDVDLSILDLLSDRWGFGGKANGEIVVRAADESAIPTGEVNITIAGLQRAGVTGISIPIDVRLAGSSDGSGLLLGAALSWQKNDLGRLILRVDPGPGATPAERFAAGRLSGGVRYNGPVEPLWALGGFEGQELKGPVAIGADVSGTPAAPQLSGLARGKGLIYRNAAFGTEIVDLAFDGRFGGNQLKLNSIAGRANG
ncbi:MAG: hypothetical protein ACRC1J_04885, partial [Sandaracinobacteroides sp.]